MFSRLLSSPWLRAFALVLLGYAICAYFQSQIDFRHVYTYQCGAYQQQSVWTLSILPFHPAPPMSLFGN